jgi:hypothetical protein
LGKEAGQYAIGRARIAAWDRFSDAFTVVPANHQYLRPARGGISGAARLLVALALLALLLALLLAFFLPGTRDLRGVVACRAP